MSIIQIEPQKNRKGTYETGHWFIPTDTKGKYRVGTNILLADMENTSNIIKFNIYVSDDNIEFKHLAGFTWEGGNYTDRLGNLLPGPGLEVESFILAGKWAKIVFGCNNPMRVGFQIEQIG